MRRLTGWKRRLRFKHFLLCGRPWVECHYCGVRLTLKTLTFDHVIPLSKGGAMGIKNIIPACRTCNCKRGNTDYEKFVRRIAA